MKKTLLILIAAVTMSVTTNAQVAFGVKAGLNVSSVSGLAKDNTTVGPVSTSNKPRMKLGGQGGVYANIQFGKMLGFQPEVLFSMKGYKHIYDQKSGSNQSKTTSSVTLSYVEIPLQLRINPTEKFFILAGPYFGILAAASSTTTTENTTAVTGTVTTESKSSSSNGLKTMDFGVAVGLGLKAENGFVLGFKYSRGFGTIFENDTNGANVNSVMQLFVGFEFGGK